MVLLRQRADPRRQFKIELGDTANVVRIDINSHARISQQDVRVMVEVLGNSGDLVDECDTVGEVEGLELRTQVAVNVTPTGGLF